MLGFALKRNKADGNESAAHPHYSTKLDTPYVQGQPGVDADWRVSDRLFPNVFFIQCPLLNALSFVVMSHG
ncbi:MAG: hypothetical protein F6K09_16800 [Merismopedia sp. SIO2A8]|nr:hypothetical protein [Symploca sp. SIO2B6]NET50319.1 hypothetical protein [Merismopedia sp. SIO2A8]